ncbi:hypothetical protein [Viridibacillus arvi]|uniref:hypothetical protein n=1 Tax=Viridibacillus arvi TaxID=263475 RepID=UPI00187B5C62|nr:hypothetical protein [Viridibacillus sp. JNUCC-6]QOV13203.1 hypothetical protein JNUCC6_10920 [Viridibacillus sp. JNUCC-6]
MKKVKSIIIALSGTPESIMKLKPYFSREIKVLREVDNTNNHIRKIILTDEIHRFKLLRKRYLNDGYKLIELVSNSNSFIDFQKELANYKVATLMSKSNPKKSLYMNEYDELVLETIIKKEELICDAIATTKFLDVGVNINAHQNFVATYNSNEQTNTIEQFRSRVRFGKDTVHHLDLVFKVMTK